MIDLEHQYTRETPENDMSTMTSQPNQSNGHRSNALSDQPPHVREAILAQLETTRARQLPTPTKGDARGLDPTLIAAITTIVESIVGLVANRSGFGTRDLDRGEMKKDHILGPGAVEYFPTWSFWGRTFVQLHNSGTVPTVVMINEDRFHLNPDERTEKDGLWAAFPIRVVNTIELPGSQVTVHVT
jgi:hypothetical protein